jgi:hypothetical protein
MARWIRLSKSKERHFTFWGRTGNVLVQQRIFSFFVLGTFAESYWEDQDGLQFSLVALEFGAALREEASLWV